MQREEAHIFIEQFFWSAQASGADVNVCTVLYVHTYLSMDCSLSLIGGKRGIADSCIVKYIFTPSLNNMDSSVKSVALSACT